jgi:hypothetical protein
MNFEAAAWWNVIVRPAPTGSGVMLKLINNFICDVHVATMPIIADGHAEKDMDTVIELLR